MHRYIDRDACIRWAYGPSRHKLPQGPAFFDKIEEIQRHMPKHMSLNLSALQKPASYHLSQLQSQKTPINSNPSLIDEDVAALVHVCAQSLGSTSWLRQQSAWPFASTSIDLIDMNQANTSKNLGWDSNHVFPQRPLFRFTNTSSVSLDSPYDLNLVAL